MVNFDVFENEERILVNHITANVNLDKVDRNNILKSLMLSSTLAEDSEVKLLVDSTRSKIMLLSDEEWDSMKKLLPWECEEGTTEEEIEALEEVSE